LIWIKPNWTKGVENGRLGVELEKARAEARDALIAGKKPTGTAAALAERIRARNIMAFLHQRL